MKKQTNGFVFLASYYNAIKKLEPKIQIKILNAIFEFVFCNKEKKLSGISNVIFSVIKPTIVSGLKRYKANVLNGMKGGAPFGNSNKKSTQNQPNINPTLTQHQPNGTTQNQP